LGKQAATDHPDSPWRGHREVDVARTVVFAVEQATVDRDLDQLADVGRLGTNLLDRRPLADLELGIGSLGFLTSLCPLKNI
jgi:hypothetical protein